MKIMQILVFIHKFMNQNNVNILEDLKKTNAQT